MKKTLKIIGIILLVIVLLMALLFLGVKWFFQKMLIAPMVPANYTEIVEAGGEIEAAYLATGNYETAYLAVPAPEEWGKYIIFYPKELERSEKTYPVVVLVNGTGVYASRYPALFAHLASWGFIVIGNEDPSTCMGTSANAALSYILSENENADSIFYHKADVDNIGISGHSQGGVGTFNAITIQEHNDLYKCAVSLSPTESVLADALHMPYDASQTTIPIMILAGTEHDVISLEGMQQMYQEISAPKLMARKSARGHGEMLYCADGYVTAWFMWLLQGDTYAAGAFTGEHPEILYNALYQDQQSNLAD